MACMSGSTALHRRTVRSCTRRSPHRPTRAQSVALAVAALVIGPAAASAQDGAVLIRLGATQSYRSSTLDEQPLSERGPGFDAEVNVRPLAQLPAEFRFRLSARQLSSTTGSVDPASATLDVLLGPDLLKVGAGRGRRSLSGAFGSRRWSYWRLGGEITLPLEIPRLAVDVGASLYLDVTADDDGSGGRGREAELRVSYGMSGWLDLSLGYRFEEFSAESDGEVLTTRPERTATVMLAIGFNIF